MTTYAISVPTPFNDISELAESFASRVDDERLMLPHAEQVPEGEWVQFAVTLADGGAALSGMGRCTGSFDNGEDRAPEHRFDVVMDSLQLEEMAQIYFERILQVRAAQMGEEPQTGQVEIPADEEVEGEAAAAAEQQLAEAGGEQVVPQEAPAEGYAEAPAEGYAEASAEGYAEAPAEGYAEAPAEGYAEAPAEGYAEAPPTDEFAGEATQAVSFDELSDAAGAEVQPAVAPEEAAPAEAYAEPVAEAAVSEAAPADEWEDADATQLGEMPADEVFEEVSTGDVAAVDEVGEVGEAAEAAGSIEPPTELRVPEQSAIYELPEPTPPGQLPSPHTTDAVLTRPSIQATWSPEPMPRPEPMPSSGLFDYAVGAGLPQPAEPPRPEMDPTLRVQPAPRPGDPHAAPAAMTEAAGVEPEAAYAEPEAAYAEEAYAQQSEAAEVYAEESPEAAEAYAEEPQAYAEEPQAHAEAGEAMEGEAPAAEEAWDEARPVDGEGAEAYVEGADGQVAEEAIVMDDAAVDATMDAEYPPIAPQEETAQVDIGDLAEQAPATGEETAVAVELPENEER